jgi:hypothetical protein
MEDHQPGELIMGRDDRHRAAAHRIAWSVRRLRDDRRPDEEGRTDESDEQRRRAQTNVLHRTGTSASDELRSNPFWELAIERR